MTRDPNLPPQNSKRVLERLVALARAELGADVCALFTFEDDFAQLRALAGDGTRFGLAAGTYRELNGPVTLETLFPAATLAQDIGAYLATPVRGAGMLCLLREPAEPVWDASDERVASALAAAVAEALAAEAELLHRRDAVAELLRTEALRILFQPVFELVSGDLVAYEALARFPGEPERPPADWFADAGDVGLGVDLELAALRAALDQLDEVPADVSLSLNISPVAAVSPRFAEHVRPVADRIVIELTEHSSIPDYAPLASALGELRARGARLAIDDVGAGYATLRHVLNLAPDIVKLDLSLTHNIAGDPRRRALAAALVDFTDELGATVAAEGIESARDFALLRDLGVSHGQGFYLGPPSTLGSLR
jgi:EAL domain-containing protein (putative c-di-GMP-specific phosphodiesterase class I)